VSLFFLYSISPRTFAAAAPGGISSKTGTCSKILLEIAAGCWARAHEIDRLLACFVVDMNERFDQNWEYLEALTVFDTKQSMVRPFLITLLRRYKMPAVRSLEFDSSTGISYRQFFYALALDEDGYDYHEESTPSALISAVSLIIARI